MHFRQAKVAPRERGSGFGIRVIFSYGFRNPGIFFLQIQESGDLESGIQLKGSGTPLIIEIENLSSTVTKNLESSS